MRALVSVLLLVVVVVAGMFALAPDAGAAPPDEASEAGEPTEDDADGPRPGSRAERKGDALLQQRQTSFGSSARSGACSFPV